jgi:hypothetical protein
MEPTTCLVCLVRTASGHHKNTLKRKCSSGHKAKQAGQEGSQGCLVCFFCFVPATSDLVEVDVSQTNLC